MDEDVNHDFICKTYSLRWRIEIIFKCWKSNMGFDKIHNVSKIQLNVWLMARFIVIVCAQMVFQRCRLIVKTNFNTDLSLLKLTKYLLRHAGKIVHIMEELRDPDKTCQPTIQALARFCTYDKRKRPNYQQKIDALFG